MKNNECGPPTMKNEKLHNGDDRNEPLTKPPLVYRWELLRLLQIAEKHLEVSKQTFAGAVNAQLEFGKELHFVQQLKERIDATT